MNRINLLNYHADTAIIVVAIALVVFVSITAVYILKKKKTH